MDVVGTSSDVVVGGGCPARPIELSHAVSPSPMRSVVEGPDIREEQGGVDA